MHKSSYLRMEYLVNFYDMIIGSGKKIIKVLDVGSYDVNGTYREIFKDEKYEYKGLDMVAGPNVDIVPEELYSWNEIEDEMYDLVISGQAFEHMEFPWLVIKEIARVLKPSVICIITAPSAGCEHRYPKDCYRYYPDGLAALAKWAELHVLHVSAGGVPESAFKDSNWRSFANDAYLIAQKPPIINSYLEEPFEYEIRYDVVTSRKYRKWEVAVAKACMQFDTRKPMVLFGAAGVGKRVLDILGDENVSFFVDNSFEKIGKLYCGKAVMSFDEYIKISENYNCLITASEKVTNEIRKQMDSADIKYGILY